MVPICTRKEEKMKKVLTGWQAVAHCPELWRDCAEGYPVQVTIYTDNKETDDTETDTTTDKTREKLISCVLPATVPKTDEGIKVFFAGLVRQLDSDRKVGKLTMAEYSKALRAIRTREQTTLKALTDGRLTLVEDTTNKTNKTTTDPALLAEYVYLTGKVRKEIERLTGIFSYRSKIPSEILTLKRRYTRLLNLRACIVRKYGRDNATARRITLRTESVRMELQSRKAEAIRGTLYAIWQYTEYHSDALRLIKKDVSNFTDAVRTVKTAVKLRMRALLDKAGSPAKVAETTNAMYNCKIALPDMPYTSTVIMPGYSADFEYVCRLASNAHIPFEP